MGKLFGTDGIRGKANEYPLVPSVIIRIGQAVATVLGDDRKDGCIVVGTDTRKSAGMIGSAINSGICSCGVNVINADIIPTPGVAYLTTQNKSAMGGIVISASHNPYFDNGIKVFDGDGFKLSDEMETDIERLILEPESLPFAQSSQNIGQIMPLPDADAQYLGFLRRCWPNNGNLKGTKVVIDCANGATYRIAPALLKALEAEVIPLCIDPDGKNINADCGSEYPQRVARHVIETEAHLGIALDGDGDRLAAVDETGHLITGDQVIAILANQLKLKGELKKNLVVSTIMSNIGLAQALDRMGIDHLISDVGDRRVMEKMRAAGAILGGEDSGHIICRDRHTTGDGLLSALRLMEAVVRENKPLSELASTMTVAPQTLINVAVQSKPELDTLEPIQAVIRAVETDLNGIGRVLVRYSGTQPLCRIMVEGPTSEETKRYGKRIAAVVSKSIG